MSPTAPLLGLALLLGANAPPTAGADWVRKQELEDSCAALLWLEDERQGAMCRGFVHGYLLGADGAPPLPVQAAPASERSGGESYSERALRTRLSPAYVRRVTGAKTASYCLGGTTDLADVVKAITEYLESHSDATGVIESPMVQEALMRRFPCDS